MKGVKMSMFFIINYLSARAIKSGSIIFQWYTARTGIL